MRVTIAVDGVLREIEVRPDLLLPGMEEWQDATEMDLLRAFGSAYKEAVAIGIAAAASAVEAVALPVVEHVVEPVVEPVEAAQEEEVRVLDEDLEASLALVADLPEHDADDMDVQIASVEVVAVEEAFETPVVAPVFVEDFVSHFDPEAVEETPFAEVPVEDFGQAQAYVASEDDAEAFLAPDLSVTTLAPKVTMCRCGHAVGWHASEVADQTDACQAAWPIDEREPDGPASRCACLQFEPSDVAGPSA